MPAAQFIDKKTFRPYLGRANVFARRNGTTDQPLFMGNVDAVTMSHAMAVQELQRYTPGGGTHASSRQLSGITMAMQCYDWTEENMNLLLYGQTATTASGTVTDESHTAQADRLIVLAHINPTSVVVTSDPSGTTYEEGTDYQIVGSGILILGSGNISDGAALLISYAYGEYSTLQPFTTAAPELEILIDGVNEADTANTKPAIVTVWRAQVSVAESASLTANEFGALPFAATLLPKTGVAADESAYYIKQYS